MAKIGETEWIWRDGAFVKWQDATVHVLAHSVQFGSAVFEGIRCYSTPKGPAIFRLREHLKRMFNSCKIYRMDPPWTMEQMVEAHKEVVRKNGMKECYIRPMVIRGYGAAGMVPHDSPIETFVPCWPWGSYLGDAAMEHGVDACISTWNRIAPNTIPAAAKIAGNYLSGQLIKMEALRNGFDEAIALGPEGMLSEGSGQNVFVVDGGALYTPPLDGTLLPGITRDTVIRIARDLGHEVREMQIPREMLYIADEMFFTGTAAELTPIRSVDKLPVGEGRPGEITRKIQHEFLGIAKGLIPDRFGWLTPVPVAAEIR
jgi:branched-chain amino acid aminotransferase